MEARALLYLFDMVLLHTKGPYCYVPSAKQACCGLCHASTASMQCAGLHLDRRGRRAVATDMLGLWLYSLPRRRATGM